MTKVRVVNSVTVDGVMQALGTTATTKGVVIAITSADCQPPQKVSSLERNIPVLARWTFDCFAEAQL
jgi:hypothetical protein